MDLWRGKNLNLAKMEELNLMEIFKQRQLLHPSPHTAKLPPTWLWWLWWQWWRWWWWEPWAGRVRSGLPNIAWIPVPARGSHHALPDLLDVRSGEDLHDTRRGGDWHRCSWLPLPLLSPACYLRPSSLLSSLADWTCRQAPRVAYIALISISGGRFVFVIIEMFSQRQQNPGLSRVFLPPAVHWLLKTK